MGRIHCLKQGREYLRAWKRAVNFPIHHPEASIRTPKKATSRVQ